MMIIQLSIFFIITGFATGYPKTIPIGVIVQRGEEDLETILRYVIWTQQRTLIDAQPPFVIELLKVVAEDNDIISFHQAICSLLNQGIVALVTPTASPYFSLIAAYSNEFHIPLISPELPEEIAYLSTQYAVGVRPSTTRAILSLIQYYGWKDIVYLYDHDYGPDKIQHIFQLGYRVLNLRLLGILKVTSAEDANYYLRKLDSTQKHKYFHVILDTESSLARDIIIRHVHDVHVRKKNFHFMLTKPTLEDFWTSQAAEYGALNVTGFLAVRPDNSRYKIFREEWMQLSPAVWTGAGTDLNVTGCYYHDVALVLLQTVEHLIKAEPLQQFSRSDTTSGAEPRDCFQEPPVPLPGGGRFANIIKSVHVQNGLTGKIQFDRAGMRKDFDFSILESKPFGYDVVGYWSNGVLRTTNVPKGNVSFQPLIQDHKWLQITTIISPPYMMLKKGANASNLKGNDRFEGFCKDIIDLIAEELNFQYDLKLVGDGEYGMYDKTQGKWTGMVGEIIQGKADLAVADLTITGMRQRVVDFTDPFETVGFSLVMKNPNAVLATSSMFFFLSAFSVNVWICIIISLIVFSALFHLSTKFTGAPDSIESASGIWGRKPTLLLNIWFTISTSMMKGTGVYPRSVSSRILSVSWWAVTLILACLFIASMTTQWKVGSFTDENSPQAAQLKALSMETIISESLLRGWPKIGVVAFSNPQIFVKKSTLPIFKQYAEFIANNPDMVVANNDEGLEKVRKSAGDFMLLLDSLSSEYYKRQKPCDLVATPDMIAYVGYGIAAPLRSSLRLKVNAALENLKLRGVLGHLHRKWWIESSQCKNGFEPEKSDGTLHTFSGLFYVTIVGLLILLVVAGIQYARKSHVKESRRQQLSFEDMNLGRTLPTPPPELLAEPPPVLNLPEYDKKTLL